MNPALIDTTDNTKSSNEMPVATSSPKPKETKPGGANKQTNPLVPDETLTPEDKSGTVQSDTTTDPMNFASGNKNTTDLVPSNSDEGTENADKASDTDQNNKNSGEHLSLDNNNKPGNVNSENDKIPIHESDDTSTSTLDVKPTRGEFHTRIVGIQRQEDPRAFKCSCCSKRTMTLCELNAHFISTHRQVKCDMCDQYFNMPYNLKKHNHEFLFETQLHSYCHSHLRGRSYFCVHAGCNKSLNMHAKHIIPRYYLVNIVDYNTHDKRNLKSHLRKHTQVQKFKCKRCNQTFTHTMQHRPRCESMKTEDLSKESAYS